jgi:hypothetical protein
MSSPGNVGFPSGLLQETTRADLDSAWLEREEEAQALLTSGYRSVALSLRLYALEIRLKSRICKQLNLDFLPKACKTHDLGELLIFTGLWQIMTDPSNQPIRQNWDLLVTFSKGSLNNIRYLPRGNLPLNVLDPLFAALDDPTHGVLQWLSKHQ